MFLTAAATAAAVAAIKENSKPVNGTEDIARVGAVSSGDETIGKLIAEAMEKVSADGVITAPEAVRTKLELGDGYGMRGASALGKEWYEHSAGYCSYLKGKTEAEAASIPADGSDPDLAALCTISIDALQKAVGDAFENGSL